MQLTRSLWIRAGLVGVVTLGVVGLAPTGAATASTTSEDVACANARVALAQVRQQRAAVRANLADARAVLRKAKADRRPAKVRAAKRTVDRIARRNQALGRTVNFRLDRASFVCAAPNSAQRALATGSVLGLLAESNGLDLGAIGVDQLVALLDDLLPGVSEHLTPAQLTALVTGFNAFANGSVTPTDLLAVLPAFSPADIASLVGGLAGSGLLEQLASTILGQFDGLLGSLGLPAGLDPLGLLEQLAGGVLPTICGIFPIPVLCD